MTEVAQTRSESAPDRIAEGSVAPTLSAVQVITPPVAPALLLDCFGSRDGFFWDEGQGVEWAGVGAAATLAADGPQRFGELEKAAGSLYRNLELVDGGEATVRPRMFGGLSFRPTICEALWRPFGAGSFVLPKLTIRSDGDSSTWTVIGGRDQLGTEDGRAEALAEIEQIRQTLSARASAPGIEPPAPNLTNGAARGTADDSWVKRVRSAVNGIREGRLEKVVFARREVVVLDGVDPQVSLLLELLRQHAPESRRFVMRRAGAVFVGATPERLVRRRGRLVETAALAGTIHRRAGVDVGALGEQLMHSAKDRHEHELVVAALRNWLQPLCESLDVPETPSVRTLRYLLHLETAVRGRLAQPLHVLRLVEALHPTPAVGGRPRREAISWIDAHEHFDRGWYASPVGWFDETGDGDFHVALRSMLLSGGRAYLYAGAGIVDESEASQEFAETEDKLEGIHAIVRQLGACSDLASVAPSSNAPPERESRPEGELDLAPV